MEQHPLPEPNFDRVARVYRWAEYLALGPLLQQTRIALLDRLAGCTHALLLGDGDGRFLARLLQRYPDMQATAVDSSAAMLRLLRARCAATAPNTHLRLTTLLATALSAPVPPAIDLVVTHFFLDCLRQGEVECLANKLAATLQPGTLWLLSDFAIPDRPLLRPAAHLYIRALYLAFRLLTGLRVRRLPNPQAALQASGFRRLACHRRLYGLLYSELWVLERPASHPRHNPAEPGFIHTGMHSTDAPSQTTGSPADPAEPFADAQPDPEPPVPSLPEPDPGVFHHEPGPVPSSGPPA